MINFEKYKDEILNISKNSVFIGKLKDKFYRCQDISCEDCDFFKLKAYCLSSILKWGYEEYTEPAPKLTKGEYGLCKYYESGYIARDFDGTLCIYTNKPYREEEEWSGTLGNLIKKDTFLFIKWEDEEPWSIEDLLKLEVEE